MAVVTLSQLGQRLERQVGLGLLYAARGNLSPPEGALIVGLDRASIGWLQRNIDALGDINQVPPSLHVCLIRRLAVARA